MFEWTNEVKPKKNEEPERNDSLNTVESIHRQTRQTEKEIFNQKQK